MSDIMAEKGQGQNGDLVVGRAPSRGRVIIFKTLMPLFNSNREMIQVVRRSDCSEIGSVVVEGEIELARVGRRVN